MSVPLRLEPAEAASMVLAAMHALPSEQVPLAEALDRVLFADLIAPFAMPPWTNASMDGYAARASDVLGASPANPKKLAIVGASRAGGDSVVPLPERAAIRIFTGAEIPAGADSVVRQEDTTHEGDVVHIVNDRDAFANVRAAGGDVAAGSTVLSAGTRIGPGQIAMLAAMGQARPTVFRRPHVGILGTGDELVPVDQLNPAQPQNRLADSNGPMLAALVTRAGGIPVMLGIAPDDAATIRSRISGAPQLDLLLTAGGVSVGDHDHLPSVMESLGIRFDFRRVRMRPGGPVSFGVLPNRLPWLGLPGNPVSAFVTFTLFGNPAVRALAGESHPSHTIRFVTINDAIPRDRVLDLYLRARLGPPQHGRLPTARLTGAQGSGIMSSIAGADVLLKVPAGEKEIRAGEVVEAIGIS